MYFHFVTISAAVSALLSILLAVSPACRDCMKQFGPALSSIYKKPKNFTDLCNENNLDPQAVPFTYCPTICIRMWEEPAVADEQLVGVRIRGHIRGCLDELLYNGFNQTIVTWYRWMHRDSCRQYRKRELFKLPTELSDDSYISINTSRELEQKQLQSTAAKPAAKRISSTV
uniref:Bm8665 n=1 Tax=Brugia malayi TaxID=6279 RepID=A0A1I9G6J8_BRUMA|nr:Bm8665 [Brugia malayi]